MKKNLHLILGIIGLGLVGYSMVAAWNGFTPKFGSLPPVENPGLEHWQGLVAGGMSLVAAVLIFMKNKLAVVPAVIVIGMALFVMLVPEKDLYKPMIGIWLAIGGGALQAVGALLAPKKTT